MSDFAKQAVYTEKLEVLSAHASLLIDNMPKARYMGFFLFLGRVLGAKPCLKSAVIYL